MDLRRASALLALLFGSIASHAASVGLAAQGSNTYPNGDTFLARSDSVLLAGEDSVYAVAYNPSTNMALYACNATSPATVVQVNMGSLTVPPTRVGAVQLNSGEDSLVTAVVDPVNNVALFGTDSNPAQIIKIAFGTGGNPPTRVGAVTLNAGENRAYAAVFDTSTGLALFGTFTSPGIVVKINPGAAAAAPTRDSAVSLLTGEDSLASAVIDSSGTALFGTYTFPGKVVKVIANAIGVPPTRDNVVALNAGENQLVSGVLDTTTGEALFGTFTSPGIVVKVGFGTASNPPVRVGAVTLNSGENVLYCAAIDSTHGVAMFGTNSGAAFAVKINVNAQGTAPTRDGGVALPSGQTGFVASHFDPLNSRFVLVPDIGSNTKLHSVLYSPQGMVTGTAFDLTEAALVNEVRFFSHVGSSAVRLAIYDSAFNLKWETSGHVLTSASTELVAPISGGTPSSLILPAGKYFAAFQVSTPDPVPSFTAGQPGDGFVFFQDFNPFPASISQGLVTSTSSRYTEYITYDPYTSGPSITSFTADDNPGFPGVSASFTLNATAGGPMTYSIDFGDATAAATGSLQSGTAVSVTHAFAAPGTYTVTATVSDGVLPVSASVQESIPAPASGGGGTKNVSDNKDPVQNPLDGLTINVLHSDGGVIQLLIDDSQLRATTSITTVFGDVPGRGATATGRQPVHPYKQHGIFVADVTATNTSTNTTVGHGRKTLALSKKETGETVEVSGDAPSAVITAKTLKGKFIFSAQKDDVCSFSGTIKLPAGLDTSKPHDVALALGNIVATTTVNEKGIGAPVESLKKLKVKFLKVKKGATTVGGEEAKIDAQFIAPGMVDAGFDTEGVTSKAIDATDGKKANRSIQVAIVLAGVPYETLAPVTFAISKKKDTGQIVGRKATGN
jgi:PKD repeat protein